MDIKDLTKTQLILLAVLLSFVTSIATGITTVTLMQQAPNAVTVPITQIVRETVETIAPKTANNIKNAQALSADQKKLLEDLKAIKPLTMTLAIKGEKEDKVLGTGLFLGDGKVVIASIIPTPKEGEVYVVKSVLGEQKVSKVTQEKDFTIIELAKNETTPPPATETQTTPTTPVQ